MGVSAERENRRATDQTRVALVDLENVLGSARVRSRVLRTRLAALLAAIGPVHQVVAGYGIPNGETDPIVDRRW